GAERLPADAATFKVFAEKLTAAREKQRAAIDKLAALDLPGLEARQARALVALRAADADLAAGFPHDIPASQAWARRELERLRLAPPPAWRPPGPTPTGFAGWPAPADRPPTRRRSWPASRSTRRPRPTRRRCSAGRPTSWLTPGSGPRARRSSGRC